MGGMPHTTNPASIPLALKAVASATIPGKVTPVFLAANGIPESEGGHMVGMLRALGFVDSGGRPTQLWHRYRNEDTGPVALAAALRNVYAPLFARYSNAHQRDVPSLAKIIRRHTEYSDHHVNRTAECFLVLAQHANFDVSVISAERAPATRDVTLNPYDRILAIRRLTAAHQEALECARHGLYRPAHVSIWNGFATLALTMLAANQFQAVRTVLPQWHGETIEDLSMSMTGKQLLEMLSTLGWITLDELDDLDILLQAHHDSAHPTFFSPSEEETAEYMSDVVAAALMLLRRRIGAN